MKLIDYRIIRGIVSQELCEFLSDYLSLKKEVYKTMSEAGYIFPDSRDLGTLNDLDVPGAFSIYGDSAFDVLLQKITPLKSKATSTELIPTYSYARSYSTGQELKKHKDRKACEVSITLNIGGDVWPIYFLVNKKKVRVDPKPGDMVIYRGDKLLHWREVFKGRYCNQVFLHYNKKEGGRLYDGRIHLGIPTTRNGIPPNLKASQ